MSHLYHDGFSRRRSRRIPLLTIGSVVKLLRAETIVGMFCRTTIMPRLGGATAVARFSMPICACVGCCFEKSAVAIIGCGDENWVHPADMRPGSVEWRELSFGTLNRVPGTRFWPSTLWVYPFLAIAHERIQVYVLPRKTENSCSCM